MMILRALDALWLSVALGGTLWFFGVQTPTLLRRMGKERFLPLQMQLTRAFFGAMAWIIPVMFAFTLAHAHAAQEFWGHVLAAGLAMLGVLLNTYVAIPRALRAGGKSASAVRKGHAPRELSAASFVSQGGGQETRVGHRVVLGLTGLMLAGLMFHGFLLLTPAPHQRHAHETAPLGRSHHVHTHSTHDATPQTRRDVHRMRALVYAALAEDPEAREVPGKLRGAYQQIFRGCTMTGPAHDALHEVLVPVGHRLSELERGAPRRAGLRSLDAALGVFDQRFSPGR